jgi:chemotaxis protein methyltransferase CheR
MFEITIDETNNIIHEIFQHYGTDLSGLALTSMRLRISKFCRFHHITSTEKLITRLNEEPELLDLFMQGIYSGSPDMFRDPELWITMRDEILPGMRSDDKQPMILIPDATSGEEIYSMSILLKESRLDNRVRLTATCINETLRKLIENGPLAKGRYKNCQENYMIFNPDSRLDKYFLQRDGNYYPNPGMLELVDLKVHAEDQSGPVDKANLILYRNRTIYFTPVKSQKVISRLLDQSGKGCIFIIGLKESANYLGLKDRVHVISADLNIYSKAG